MAQLGLIANCNLNVLKWNDSVVPTKYSCRKCIYTNLTKCKIQQVVKNTGDTYIIKESK